VLRGKDRPKDAATLAQAQEKAPPEGMNAAPAAGPKND
jgi:hypothetical protein